MQFTKGSKSFDLGMKSSDANDCIICLIYCRKVTKLVLVGMTQASPKIIWMDVFGRRNLYRSGLLVVRSKANGKRRHVTPGGNFKKIYGYVCTHQFVWKIYDVWRKKESQKWILIFLCWYFEVDLWTELLSSVLQNLINLKIYLIQITNIFRKRLHSSSVYKIVCLP